MAWAKSPSTPEEIYQTKPNKMSFKILLLLFSSHHGALVAVRSTIPHVVGLFHHAPMVALTPSATRPRRLRVRASSPKLWTMLTMVTMTMTMLLQLMRGTTDPSLLPSLHLQYATASTVKGRNIRAPPWPPPWSVSPPPHQLQLARSPTTSGPAESLVCTSAPYCPPLAASSFSYGHDTNTWKRFTFNNNEPLVGVASDLSSSCGCLLGARLCSLSDRRNTSFICFIRNCPQLYFNSHLQTNPCEWIIPVCTINTFGMPVTRSSKRRPSSLMASTKSSLARASNLAATSPASPADIGDGGLPTVEAPMATVGIASDTSTNDDPLNLPVADIDSSTKAKPSAAELLVAGNRTSASVGSNLVGSPLQQPETQIAKSNSKP